MNEITPELIDLTIQTLGSPKFENNKLEAYKDSSGIPTIFRGHVIKANEADLLVGVHSEQESYDTCKADTTPAMQAVVKSLKVPQNNNQLVALTILTYNIGDGGFESSTVLRMINSNAGREAITSAWLMWNKAMVNGISTTIQGLINRRNNELDIYFS